MTEITRISTLSVHTRAINNFQKVQGDLATLQDQVSSGLKGKDYQAYTGQVEQLTGLQKEVARLKMYQDHNAETTSRLQTVEDSLDSIVDLGAKVASLMTLRNNPVSTNSISFGEQLKGLRLSLAKELNVNVEGRYLFGGTKTDVPPVIDEPLVPEAVTPGTPDDNYYRGGKENVITRVQDNVDLEYTARADDPAFQKLFTAISLSLKGDVEKDPVKLKAATDQVQAAIKDMIALRSSVQSARTEVDRITTRQKDMNVDQVDAASKVAIDQATLQATFQVFAKISSLRLSDFLR
jgi:flagellar hook-associated protein 3 FlgL